MDVLKYFTSFNVIRSVRTWSALVGALAAVVGSAPNLAAAERAPVDASTIVFVCEHGTVKSTVAAAYFNRIARERGLPFVAVSRGIDLDPEVPVGVRSGLAADGLAPNDDTPRDLRAEEAASAARVIAFDHIPAGRGGNAAVTYWLDIPPVTKDYNAGRDAILRHIQEILDTLAKGP